jgi:hypothetical protein
MASRNYAATYTALYRDGTLGQQCQMALLLFAVPAIVAEDPGTANHAARLAWATAMLTAPASLAKAVALLAIQCAGNATILAAVGSGQGAEDSDVEFVASGFLPNLVAIGA